MKLMKLVFACSLFVTAIGANAQIKAGAGIVTYYNSFLLGGQVRLGIPASDNFVISGAGTYFIRKESSFAIDIDARYRLMEIGSTSFEPLVGFNISRIDGSGNTSMNLGVFVQIGRNDVDLYIEPKLVIDTHTFFVISGGFYF